MTRLVYLLEDDPDIAGLIARTLNEQGLEVRKFNRLIDFRREVARNLPDLCLIDLNLPDGDGLSAVRDILPASVPKVIVSGRGDLTDRVVGLEIGADDYIVKPFEPRELAARVKAVLRRAQPPTTEPSATSLQFGDWTVDLGSFTLHHSDGEIVRLSAAEAALLQTLAETPGRIVTRAQLLDATSGRAEEPMDRSIDARISRLRKKLRDDPYSPQIIRTVYGAGYVFAPPASNNP